MKTFRATLALFFIAVSMLHAEPKTYSGTLDHAPATITLNWLDEKNIIGFVSITSVPPTKFILTGQNTAQGQMKVFMIEDDVKLVGSVEMKKTTTGGSIIWSGTITGPAGGSQGIFEFQRPLDSH